MDYSRILFVIVLLLSFSVSYSCTRILYVTENNDVIVGNNMDWHESMPTKLLCYPRELNRNGQVLNNTLHWKSKYGSVVTVAYNRIATNGMNEAGFAAHVLSFPESNYGSRDEKINGLSIAMWVQFYLDNFSTVGEAIHYSQQNQFQIITDKDTITNKKIGLHLAIEDATGDSAIIEYTNGKAHIYHNKHYLVVTNGPSYNKAIEMSKEYAGFGGHKPLPGTTQTFSRFIRALFYVNHLPKTRSTNKAIFDLLSVLDNVSQPVGTISPERATDTATVWKSIADLSHLIYYFRASDDFNTMWIALNKLNFLPGSPVLSLDLRRHDLSGDMTQALTSNVVQ